MDLEKFGKCGDQLPNLEFLGRGCKVVLAQVCRRFPLPPQRCRSSGCGAEQAPRSRSACLWGNLASKSSAPWLNCSGEVAIRPDYFFRASISSWLLLLFTVINSCVFAAVSAHCLLGQAQDVSLPTCQARSVLWHPATAEARRLEQTASETSHPST